MIERENTYNPRALAELKTPEEIQEDVRRARSVIAEDIKEIKEKLKPSHLKENALEAWHSAKDQAMTAVTHRGKTVAQTGAPILLMGLGAGWLAMTLRKQREDQHWYSPEPRGEQWIESGEEEGGAIQERAESTGHALASRARDYTTRARDYTSELRTGLTERRQRAIASGRDMMHAGRERASALQHRTRDFVSENPFAVGMGLFAAGIGLGMLLPVTQREKRVLGPVRDRLMGQARGVAEEVRGAAGRIGETAGHIGETARSTVGEMKEAAMTDRSGPH